MVLWRFARIAGNIEKSCCMHAVGTWKRVESRLRHIAAHWNHNGGSRGDLIFIKPVGRVNILSVIFIISYWIVKMRARDQLFIGVEKWSHSCRWSSWGVFLPAGTFVSWNFSFSCLLWVVRPAFVTSSAYIYIYEVISRPSHRGERKHVTIGNRNNNESFENSTVCCGLIIFRVKRMLLPASPTINKYLLHTFPPYPVCPPEFSNQLAPFEFWRKLWHKLHSSSILQ